jgi:hypothetical protein
VEAGGEHQRLRRNGAITGEVTDLSTQAARHDSTERAQERGSPTVNPPAETAKCKGGIHRTYCEKQKQVTLRKRPRRC